MPATAYFLGKIIQVVVTTAIQLAVLLTVAAVAYDIPVVGCARASSMRPQVILPDLLMPGVSGLEALKVIVEEVPEARVLMLTVSEDAQDLLDALRAGACGYLLKNIETEVLIDGVRRVAAGESVVAQQMTAKLVAGVRSQPRQDVPPPDRERFSPRERDILASLAQGESNKEIARRLDLAESTEFYGNVLGCVGDPATPPSHRETPGSQVALPLLAASRQVADAVPLLSPLERCGRSFF